MCRQSPNPSLHRGPVPPSSPDKLLSCSANRCENLSGPNPSHACFGLSRPQRSFHLRPLCAYLFPPFFLSGEYLFCDIFSPPNLQRRSLHPSRTNSTEFGTDQLRQSLEAPSGLSGGEMSLFNIWSRRFDKLSLLFV